jgi:DNA-binding NarL/FixJ family response regulator
LHGRSNKRIPRLSLCTQRATRLVITPKTARNHIEHIYAKTGTSNRVRASLFAVQHGLIPEDVAFAER